MEDFPALPVTNKKFEIRKDAFSMARSSASTTSIGATEAELRCTLTKGAYMIMDSFDLRRSLYCTCRNCKTQYPTAENFGDCENATFFDHSEFRCRVTDSKVIRHRVTKEQFSVSYIRSDVDMYDEDGYPMYHETTGRNLKVQGWVKSKYLRKEITASKSVEPAFRFHQEVDRSRSPSVFLDSHFKFGDLVLVNTGVRGENWVRGEVRQERPLLILVEGTTTPQPFHASNIKDHPTRQFVAVKDLAVRRNKFRENWSVATVKAGTTIEVAYMDGFEGRVVAPFQGWVTMRDTYYSALNVVESNWTLTTEFEDLAPTMIITNLPQSITENSLRTHLFLKCFVKAKDIEFQRKGDKFRAVVTFSESFRAISNVVQKQTSEFRFGWNISMKWDMLYLKNRAQTILDNKRFRKQTRI